MKTGHYKVLKPSYSLDHASARQPNGERFWRVEWEQIGVAASMEDAKARFGGAPVLEWQAA